MTKLLLLGASGMFGTDGLPVFRDAGVDVLGEDLPEVDITSRESLAACLDRHRPEVVLNASAYTQVDRAESEPEAAFRVNAEGAGYVAEACRDRNTLLVHISTDYVFPGERPEGYSPCDLPGPAPSIYGASKLSGEAAVRAALPPERILLCRTQWLYGSKGPNFVETILRLASQREEIRVVDDQWGVPTRSADLAFQILSLLNARMTGVFHTVGGGGPITWHTFASAIIEMAGFPCRVTKCTSAEYPRPARRPTHAWLRNVGVPREAVRPWRSSLETHLAALGMCAGDRPGESA